MCIGSKKNSVCVCFLNDSFEESVVQQFHPHHIKDLLTKRSDGRGCRVGCSDCTVLGKSLVKHRVHIFFIFLFFYGTKSVVVREE